MTRVYCLDVDGVERPGVVYLDDHRGLISSEALTLGLVPYLECSEELVDWYSSQGFVLTDDSRRTLVSHSSAPCNMEYAK